MDFDDIVGLAAAADPYPAYAELVSQRPLFATASGFVVASSAAAVAEALSHPSLRVRPTDEPTPAPLVGTKVGALFAQLIRMNDSPAREPLRASAVAAFEALKGLPALARDALEDLDPGRGLTRFCSDAGLHAVAALLGVARRDRAEAASAARELSAALSLRGSGEAALAALTLLLGGTRETFFGDLREGARLANAIGFLVQTSDATAGLIGNALLVRPREASEQFVEEVARFDSPVQSTRRYAAAPMRLGPLELAPGDCVLVLLAAANRDPAANPDPRRFDVRRPSRRLFSFGVGAHACVGRAVAVAVARAALMRLCDAHVPPHVYRASPNLRIPLFEEVPR